MNSKSAHPLREKPQPADLTADLPWALIKGPVLITSAASSPAGNPGPRSMDLWDESARAMRAFEKSDVYDFVKAGWNFTARPVRASEEICLRCHRGPARTALVAAGDPGNTLKIGDPIGVVLYGYTPIK